MTLKKAIKVVSSNGLKPEGITWGEYLEAVKLLIEAGKREQEARPPGRVHPGLLLPGETEE